MYLNSLTIKPFVMFGQLYIVNYGRKNVILSSASNYSLFKRVFVVIVFYTVCVQLEEGQKKKKYSELLSVQSNAIKSEFSTFDCMRCEDTKCYYYTRIRRCLLASSNRGYILLKRAYCIRSLTIIMGDDVIVFPNDFGRKLSL